MKKWPRFHNIFFYYTVPRNRCFGDIVGHLQMIALILVVMINPLDQEKKLDPNWYDILLCLWAVGCLARVFREIFFFSKSMHQNHKKRKHNYRTHLYNCLKNDFLQISAFKSLAAICGCFILAGLSLKAKGFWPCVLEEGLDFPINCLTDNPLTHCDDSPLKTSYALIGIGATLCILTLLHWFELNSYLGPVLIALRRTIGDILKILTTFIFFLFAFSVGLHFSLKYSNMYCEGEHAKIEGRKHLYANDTDTCDGFAFAVNTTMQGFNLEDDVNQFRRFKQSMKTCFWSLFDPGHPEVIGCTQVA